MSVVEQIPLTWPALSAFLVAQGHPWELILHPDDFRRIRGMLGQNPQYDSEGPYLWIDTTKVRPAKGQERVVDVSEAPVFTSNTLHWREGTGWR